MYKHRAKKVYFLVCPKSPLRSVAHRLATCNTGRKKLIQRFCPTRLSPSCASPMVSRVSV